MTTVAGTSVGSRFSLLRGLGVDSKDPHMAA
jgi:hypothetical protein